MTFPLNKYEFTGVWYEVASYKKYMPMNKNCMVTFLYNEKVDELYSITECNFNSKKIKIDQKLICNNNKCKAYIVGLPEIDYIILDTDYKSYAIVDSGNNNSLIQILSRKQYVSIKEIQLYKDKLYDAGYAIHDVLCMAIPIEGYNYYI